MPQISGQAEPRGPEGGREPGSGHRAWLVRRLRAVLRLKPGVTFRIVAMDTTLARVPVGQLLDGRYRVAAHLAHGGMATVYVGTDTRLDRAVALKIMHAELANDE